MDLCVCNLLSFRRQEFKLSKTKYYQNMFLVWNNVIVKRHGVARAVLQGPQLLTEWHISSKPSKYTKRVRELKFWEKVHPLTTCQVSGVRCQVSGIRCQVSGVRCSVSPVRCHASHFFYRTKWWGYLVEGLLSTVPTPSSFR